MNSISHPIAIAALQGPTNPALPIEPTWCSKTGRLIFQQVLGPNLRKLFGTTARETYELWEAAGLIVGDHAAELEHGDLVLKPDAGRDGHLGIYCGAGLIFENSSTKIGRIRGALGFRTIEQFGGPIKIGRYRLRGTK